MLGFISVTTNCVASTKNAPTIQTKHTCNRRLVSQLILSSTLYTLAYPTITMAQENERAEHDATKKRFFAETMETGMNEYEKSIAPVKEKLFSQIKPGSVVVDIGIGTGPNLKYMPPNVQVIGVEPNEFMWPYAKKKAERLNIDLKLVKGISEQLPVEDESCDFVLTTIILCSVSDPSRTIREILRILKPGGTHLFIEHVIASPKRPILQVVQKIMNPLQKRFADGCNLNRDTGSVLKSFKGNGFREVEYDSFVMELGGLLGKVSLIGPHVAGHANKA